MALQVAGSSVASQTSQAGEPGTGAAGLTKPPLNVRPQGNMCEITLQGGMGSEHLLDTLNLSNGGNVMGDFGEGETGDLFLQLLQSMASACPPPAVPQQSAVTAHELLQQPAVTYEPSQQLAVTPVPHPPPAEAHQRRPQPQPLLPRHVSQPGQLRPRSQPLSQLSSPRSMRVSQLLSASQGGAQYQHTLAQDEPPSCVSSEPGPLHSRLAWEGEHEDEPSGGSEAACHSHARHGSVVMPWQLMPGSPLPRLAPSTVQGTIAAEPGQQAGVVAAVPAALGEVSGDGRGV